MRSSCDQMSCISIHPVVNFSPNIVAGCAVKMAPCIAQLPSKQNNTFATVRSNELQNATTPSWNENDCFYLDNSHIPRRDSGSNLIRVKHCMQPQYCPTQHNRSKEQTTELQSLMRLSYAVFCLKKKKNTVAIHK